MGGGTFEFSIPASCLFFLCNVGKSLALLAERLCKLGANACTVSGSEGAREIERER